MGDFVLPRESRLQSPPDSDSGEIRKVELERIADRYQGCPPKECQTCQEPVVRAEEHVYAFGWYTGGTDRLRTFRAVFCDQACWASWASRD